jgi:hypothetical protein
MGGDDRRVLAVLETAKEGENAYVVRIGMSDQKAYFLRFVEAAAMQIVEGLERLLPKDRPAQMASRLTVRKASTGQLSDGQPALLLETEELGPVQVPLGLNGLDDLRRQLDELHAKLQFLTTKH